MKERLKKEVDIVFYGKYGEYARYAFVGCGTTAVNFCALLLLYDAFGVNLALGNAIAVILANIYSYFGNKMIVFHTPFSPFKALAKEMGIFLFSRSAAILIEIAGVPIVSAALKMDPYIAKVCVVAVIVVLNFIVAKFFIFKNTDDKKGKS